MNYFTSDVHFNSEPRLKLENRGFKTSEQFDRHIVKLWNSHTTKKDTIYIVGDFITLNENEFEKWKTSLTYAKKFKAKIVLIVGNNEQKAIKKFFKNSFNKFRDYCLECGFLEVYKNHTIKIKNQEFFLTHKPSDCKLDCLNLFGHIHRAGGLYRPFGINVGCDLNRHLPYSEDDIIFLLNEKNTYWNDDIDLNYWNK